jgi:hypothetical protein
MHGAVMKLLLHCAAALQCSDILQQTTNKRIEMSVRLTSFGFLFLDFFMHARKKASNESFGSRCEIV